MKQLTSDELRAEMKRHGYLTGCAWHRDDITLSMEARGQEYIESDVEAIIGNIEKYFDADCGINWDVINQHIDMHFDEKEVVLEKDVKNGLYGETV